MIHIHDLVNFKDSLSRCVGIRVLRETKNRKIISSTFSSASIKIEILRRITILFFGTFKRNNSSIVLAIDNRIGPLVCLIASGLNSRHKIVIFLHNNAKKITEHNFTRFIYLRLCERRNVRLYVMSRYVSNVLLSAGVKNYYFRHPVIMNPAAKRIKNSILIVGRNNDIIPKESSYIIRLLNHAIILNIRVEFNVRENSAVHRFLLEKYARSIRLNLYPSFLSPIDYVDLFKSVKYLLILDDYATRLSCSGTFYDAVSTGTPIIHDSDAVLQEDIDYLSYMNLKYRDDFHGIFNTMLDDVTYAAASEYVSSQACIFQSEYELNVEEMVSWMS